MAHGTKEDIEVVGDDDPRLHWPTSGAVCRKLGIHSRTLDNMVRRGDLTYVYSESKERHFDPEKLAVAGDEPIMAGSVTEVTANLHSDVIGFLKSTVKDLAKANSDLLRLATDPAKSFIQAICEENQRLRDECHALREKYIHGIESFESALDNRHTRDLEKKKQESHDKRLDNALESALKQLPHIVAGLSGKKAVSGFIDSLTEEQKGILLTMLTREQVARLTSLFTQLKSETTNGGNGATDSEEKDESS